MPLRWNDTKNRIIQYLETVLILNFKNIIAQLTQRCL